MYVSQCISVKQVTQKLCQPAMLFRFVILDIRDIFRMKEIFCISAMNVTLKFCLVTRCSAEVLLARHD